MCNGRHKLTNNFFTFHLVCAHCLPFFVAFLLLFLLLLLLQASFSPHLLPLLRLYVHRACVCVLVYEHFLFLLSRIFMQSAALHFLTLQLLFAFRFVLFSVCVHCVCVCALCVYAMRRFVVSFNCTDTSLILSCSFQQLLFFLLLFFLLFLLLLLLLLLMLLSYILSSLRTRLHTSATVDVAVAAAEKFRVWQVRRATNSSGSDADVDAAAAEIA